MIDINQLRKLNALENIAITVHAQQRLEERKIKLSDVMKVIMICMSCGAKAEKSTTTYVRDLGKCIIIIRNVPCFKCSECNEVVYTGDVLEKINRMVETLKPQMTEIAVADYEMAA